MVRAVFLDFYGTVVHEDGEVIKKIIRVIAETGQVKDPSEVSSFWWNEFQTMCHNSYGEAFQTQRALEYQSLVNTLEKFRSTADPRQLSGWMFEHWRRPPAFDDAPGFFAACPVPIYIVSNIDTEDIMAAVRYHGFTPQGVFTSEAARSYKPRKELFELALRETGLRAAEAVHIGDSIHSDVEGAGALGIHTIWLNRSGREVPENVAAVSDFIEVLETEYLT